MPGTQNSSARGDAGCIVIFSQPRSQAVGFEHTLVEHVASGLPVQQCIGDEANHHRGKRHPVDGDDSGNARTDRTAGQRQAQERNHTQECHGQRAELQRGHECSQDEVAAEKSEQDGPVPHEHDQAGLGQPDWAAAGPMDTILS